ncbi:EamA family transporter [Marinomonas pollencensis]|uniref:Inner membrane transporter RhtA n=1 Tax=Marinomonas pollencensis TaxID=491954 RepID=A0A3E0DPY1_9GAMM|nr:EamA family transporter [Marinomonas pollencensis]REG84302.1 inner membrane transporter RhtA [Marinomonas pollencensis]
MKASAQFPMAAAFASLISLQVGAAFAKTIFPMVGPDGVAALRIGISAVLLAIAFQPWSAKISATYWPSIITYGAMIGLMNFLIYRAFLHIPVGIAISIEVLGPLAISLLSSKRKTDILWILLALIGVLLLPFNQANAALSTTGLVYAVLAAICWGLYIKTASTVSQLGSKGVTTGLFVAALFMVPIGISQAGSALFTPTVLLLGLVIALLSSALPFLLDMYALKRLPRSIFGVLMSASPAVSAMAGAIILNEQLSSFQWLGIFAISLACLGASLTKTP